MRARCCAPPAGAGRELVKSRTHALSAESTRMLFACIKLLGYNYLAFLLILCSTCNYFISFQETEGYGAQGLCRICALEEGTWMQHMGDHSLWKEIALGPVYKLLTGRVIEEDLR